MTLKLKDILVSPKKQSQLCLRNVAFKILEAQGMGLPASKLEEELGIVPVTAVSNV